MATLLGEIDVRDEDSRAGAVKVVLDLTNLEGIEAAAPLVRYARSIVLERGDWNGRVLSIRRDDVRALCSMLQVDEQGLVAQLDTWKVLAESSHVIDLTDKATEAAPAKASVSA